MQQPDSSNWSDRRLRARLTLTGEISTSLENSVVGQQPQMPEVETPPEMGSLLTNPPTPFSSTGKWVQFRAALVNTGRTMPNHPKPPAYLEAVDHLLAWRGSLPESLHFWDLD